MGFKTKVKVFIVSDEYKRWSISNNPQSFTPFLQIMVNSDKPKIFRFSTDFMTEDELRIEINNLKFAEQKEQETNCFVKELNEKTNEAKILAFPKIKPEL